MTKESGKPYKAGKASKATKGAYSKGGAKGGSSKGGYPKGGSSKGGYPKGGSSKAGYSKAGYSKAGYPKGADMGGRGKPIDFRMSTVLALMPAKKEGLTLPKLIEKLSVGKKQENAFKTTLQRMVNDEIIAVSHGSYYLKGIKKYFTGVVTKVAKTHGFIRNPDKDEEYFVRGRDLLGAVPGDTLLAKLIEEKSETNPSAVAKGVVLLKEGDGILTGVVTELDGEMYVRPDSFVAQPLQVIRYSGNVIRNGDKVRFVLHHRGERHSEHTVDIVSIYGDSDRARVCVQAYLEEKRIPVRFSEEVVEEAKACSALPVSESEMSGRVDLRELPIFTIDGADTKDIDDAISIIKTKDGYELGVHIADVSHYVKANSELDKAALQRGNSVYIADTVIPMLPKELSNGICSLNPQVERLAFSCLMKLDGAGTIKSFRFAKSVIRSRVKGVYSEINSIISGNPTEEIKAKYAEVIAGIPLMQELADILSANRVRRGAPEIVTRETKIICDEDGACVDIKARTGGISEGIIEEFMLCANNCAAKLAMEQGFPFVYRIHESPSAEKLETLAQTLVMLGIEPKNIGENSTAADLAVILREQKDNPKYDVINTIILRSMMKAKYSPDPVGHFGLVMKEYAHFTSPIRRYADLSIHRILTDFAAGADKDKLTKRYAKFAANSSMQASNTELTAVNAERDCDKFYMAEYMKKHVGEDFEGIISGVTYGGFFVVLDNTVEGRVDATLLPPGTYDVENNISLVETLGGARYTLGDKVKVRCAGVSVPEGKVDFMLL